MVVDLQKKYKIADIAEKFCKEVISNPKISVIIPAYNSEKYIVQCLSSIISQTFKELEIIVINDGSTDNTAKILSFFEEDSRVKIINQSNSGLSVARNVGMEASTGDYISFVDSDDWIDLDYLESLYNAITKYDADISVATILRKRKNSEKYRVLYTEETVYTNLEDKLKSCNVPICCYVWNKLYKRELIQNKKFTQGVYFEDVLWTPEIIKSANKLVTVPNVNYYYRVNHNSIVKTNTPKKQNDSYLAKKYIIEFFEKNNLCLSKKERTISKRVHYLFKIPIVRVKEYKNKELYFLFGLILFYRKKFHGE